MATAAILTIGNELVCGDVPNTNASWLARRLEALGISVHLIGVVPDELDAIVGFLQREGPLADVVLVTGGLGGTPDDITREAVGAAFGVEQEEVAELAEDLRARFRYAQEYVTRWAQLPAGSRPLANPLGGAPGFVIGNVYVVPGLPAEMEAMFLTIEDELRRERPIGSWRKTYSTTEATIVRVLEEVGTRHPSVTVGSYPSFQPEGARVEVVVKSNDPDALAAATTWIEEALDRALADAERPQIADRPRYP